MNAKAMITRGTTNRGKAVCITAIAAIINLVLSADAQTIEHYTYNSLIRIIPDGSRSGLIDVHTLSSNIRSLSAVRVKLNISGQYNGDLYAYLRHVNGQATNFCVLLNRPGRSASLPAGYSDAGINVSFDAAAANDIHLYRNFTSVPAGSALLGTWQPDGRAVDPLGVLDTTSRNTSLGSFKGPDGSGEWTLFLADVDAGATNVLVSWELELVGAIAPPLVWLNPPDIVYGTTLSAAQLNASAGGVAGTYVYSPPAGSMLTAGSNQNLFVTFTPSDAASYVPATMKVALNVLKAPLTFTANNMSRSYGDSNPVFTGSISGLKYSDPITASYNCPAAAGSGVGSYPIVPSPSGTRLTNYIVTVVNGTLTVNAASLTVTASNAARLYGDANPAFTGSINGVKNGDAITASYGCSATPASPIGSYSIVPSPAGATLSNYSVTVVNGTLAVNPASLTVTAANANRLYGTANPTFTGNISGIRNSDAITATYNCSANIASPAGTYDITPAGFGSALGNYTVNIVKGTLTINRAASSGVVTSSSNPQVPGQPVTFSLALSPVPPSVGTPTGTVQFRVDGAPAGAPVGIVSGVATYTTSGLSLGNHTIITEYAGNPNFTGTTNSLAALQLINTPPIAAADMIERYPTEGVKVAIATLLANDSDPDGDPVSFLSASAVSANGATMTRQGEWLFYSPPGGFINIDSFTYTISDTRGAAATGTVTVKLKGQDGAALNLVILNLGDGSYLLRFNGIPNRLTIIEYSDSLNPLNWQPLATGISDSAGQFEYTDRPAAGISSRSYRAQYP